ncbi:MAG: transporter ATP-binding protein, partial [Chloroflexi bacterium]|nr:transporter ATP-binding protein [Chloroflexota bacterium]
MAKREFTVADAYDYNHDGALRWVASHLLRYKRLVLVFIVSSLLANIFMGFVPVVTGRAFSDVLHSRDPRSQLVQGALLLLASVVSTGIFDLGARSLIEFLGKRFARDAREELYISLLGKSQTFHNRQRVGDIMARAANDVGLLSDMIVPGVDSIFDSSSALVIPTIFIGFLEWRLLLVPLIFTGVYIVVLRMYMRQLKPVSTEMRARFGQLNAGLAETVTGIELVKATAQEEQERRKFETNARSFRDLYVRNGLVQGRYLPPLIYAIALAAGLLHGLYLVSSGLLSVGGLITFLGLMGAFRFPVFVSIFAFNVFQMGVAASDRILELIREETDLDENEAGYQQTMRGELVFDHVSFGYGNDMVVKDISFRASPGQTVAIVGQTGTGKSTLTRLVNRIYDVSAGQVLIDGIDVRDWQLDALRSQISTIEQDIFLFSKTVAENIAFGLGDNVGREAIEAAAKDAQAHDFIMNFRDGYDTVLGERGVTLSGGQRQRIAIARALLTDPRILVLDDSTSAIDSATEDEIQKAMRRLAQGRTTLLITHRLSQIRTADWVLVLRRGTIVDQGKHEDLLVRCELYARIFAHYDPALAPRALAGAGQ